MSKRRVMPRPNPCPFNEGVGCTREECHRCGWNPEVAAERLARITGAKKDGGKPREQKKE